MRIQEDRNPSTLKVNASARSGNLILNQGPLFLRFFPVIHWQMGLTLATASMDQGQILENIKMSYWWAGYYSGLYDAKQTGTGHSERQNAENPP